jgi:ribosomal protein L7Ae-like RNA K-turn-binding protein
LSNTKPNQNDRPDSEAAWRLIGLATKARRAVSGSLAVDSALRSKKAFLILVAGDSSAATKSKYIPPDRPPAVPVIVFGSKADMGHWTGHETRAVTAILDAGFARELKKLLAAP